MKDENDVIVGSPAWFRILLSSALLLGAGNGFVGLTQDTSDRYYASEARKDFALRDERAVAIKEALLSHIKWNSETALKQDAIIKDLEARVRALEAKVK